MTTEEILAECREAGRKLREDIEDVRSDIDILARALYRVIESLQATEDAALVEAEIAALRRLIARDN